jgi:hypothetical protein
MGSEEFGLLTSLLRKKELFCVRTRGRKLEKIAPPVTGMVRQSSV